MKKSVVSLLLAATALPTLSAESPVDRLVGCAEIKDSRDRLACFDREVAPLAAARRQARPDSPQQVARVQSPSPPAAPVAPPRAATPAAPAAPAPPATAPAPAARPSFGDEQLRPRDRPEAPESEQVLHARIERLRAASTTEVLVYLDNGQIWRHEDQVNGGYLRVGDAVTLSKGALSSYRLTRDAGSSKTWIRVSRVR